MVFAINISLNNQLCCLHWQDHQTVKPTELDKGQLNVNTIKPVVENMPQLRWKGQFCKQNKLDKSSNFTVNAKHAIELEGQSQSQSCFESKVGEGFQLIDLSF